MVKRKVRRSNDKKEGYEEDNFERTFFNLLQALGLSKRDCQNKWGLFKLFSLFKIL